MWRLWNKLFGWHYAIYSDSATNFIFRVLESKSGYYINSQFSIYQGFLNDKGSFDEMTGAGNWRGLTFKTLEELTKKDG